MVMFEVRCKKEKPQQANKILAHKGKRRSKNSLGVWH